MTITSAHEPRGRARYIDSELYLASERHVRFSWEGREYDDGALELDGDLRERLLELELSGDGEAYGRELFGAVFRPGGRVREGLREALAKAEGVEPRLRLRLHIAPGLPAVHGLSWELLFDPDRKVALGRSPDTAFSRYSTVSLDPGSPAPGRLRLLGVVAAPDNAERYQMAPIDRSLSHEQLARAFAPLEERVDFELLEAPATPGRLRERLAGGGYQALHVFGHGLVRRGRTSALVLEDEQGKARFVDEEVLAEIFLGDRDLRLVTLVACHGGALSSNDAFSGLAARLVERGVPAVIGMCRAVTFEVGHLFTDQLYRNLARTGRVDVAVNEARQQLFLAQPKDVAWSSPVLYMRLPDGLLWPVDEPLRDGTPPAPPTVDAVVVVPEGKWTWFRWAALALATLALALAVWPARETEAELDLVVSRVSFVMAKSQPVVRSFQLRELAASSLGSIRLPASLGYEPNPVRESELGRVLGLLLEVEPSAADGEGEGALTLQQAFVGVGRRVVLEHLGATRYRYSIDDLPETGEKGAVRPGPEHQEKIEMTVGIDGRATCKMFHERQLLLDARVPETVGFEPLNDRIELDVDFMKLAGDAFVPSIAIAGLGLLEVVETPGPESTFFEEVSTIGSGSVVLASSGLSRELEAREELRFSQMRGSINTLDPREDGIVLGVRGTFSNLESRVPGGGKVTPTILGIWMGEGPARALLVAAIVLLAVVLLNVIRAALSARGRARSSALLVSKSY